MMMAALKDEYVTHFCRSVTHETQYGRTFGPSLDVDAATTVPEDSAANEFA